jgi:hypothetical protein
MQQRHQAAPPDRLTPADKKQKGFIRWLNLSAGDKKNF